MAAVSSGTVYIIFHVSFKYPLLWEFLIYTVYRIILGRVLVGNIVYIKRDFYLDVYTILIRI